MDTQDPTSCDRPRLNSTVCVRLMALLPSAFLVLFSGGLAIAQANPSRQFPVSRNSTSNSSAQVETGPLWATRTPATRISELRPPLAFEPNRGQFNPKLRFLARGDGYTVFIGKRELIFTSAIASPKPLSLCHRAPPFRIGE
jgi:hypothetical protein